MEITTTINGQQALQQVTSFVYLGSRLQEIGDCEMDIRKRVGIGIYMEIYGNHRI